MKNLHLFLILATLLPAYAQATEIPQFDVDAACKKYTEYLGNNRRENPDLTQKSCVHLEQKNYNLLKEIWSLPPDAKKQGCIDSHLSVPDYYGSIYRCYEIETESYRAGGEAIENQGSFKY